MQCREKTVDAIGMQGQVELEVRSKLMLVSRVKFPVKSFSSMSIETPVPHLSVIFSLPTTVQHTADLTTIRNLKTSLASCS